MTRPVYEPTPVSTDAQLGFVTRQLLRRPASSGGARGAVYKIEVFQHDAPVVAGDFKFDFFIDRDVDGMDLGDVEMDVSTASSSGIVQVQIHNVTQAVDMLSTRIQVDANEKHSKDAATAVVIDTSTVQAIHSFNVSGTGSFHRISRDGKAAVAGGFNYVAWREDVNGNWNQVLNRTQSSNWFGGVAVSGDGRTMFAVSHNYATGYLLLTYRVIDLDTGTELAQTTTQGAGGWQDSVKVAQASYDGSVLAVCSWGTQDNAHPEVQVFDRDLNRIGEIDTPGSPYHIDMSIDGSVVVVGGKAVHANVFGNGGDIIAYRVFDPCRVDLNGDGVVNTQDFAIFLNLWGAGDPRADWNGDTVVNTQDFAAYLNDWAIGCP